MCRNRKETSSRGNYSLKLWMKTDLNSIMTDYADYPALIILDEVNDSTDDQFTVDWLLGPETRDTGHYPVVSDPSKSINFLKDTGTPC